MKRQAKYHGEIGANGKAYVKGQFIAEQAENNTARSNSKKSTGKQQIEPYVWEVAPDQDMKPIFSFICNYYNFYTDKVVLNEQAIAFYNEDVNKINSLVKRYRNGERWYYPNHELYLPE